MPRLLRGFKRSLVIGSSSLLAANGAYTQTKRRSGEQSYGNFAMGNGLNCELTYLVQTPDFLAVSVLRLLLANDM